MTDIPRIGIHGPWRLDDADRQRLFDELVEMAAMVKQGHFGEIPPGMPSTTYKTSPVQGVVVEIVFTRPGPLP